MECKPQEKLHRFPMGHRKCYCGHVKVPKADEDGVKDNEFLFRTSTILRRQNERLAEEEARMETENLEFNADLPEIDSKSPHVPGSVAFNKAEFMDRYTLQPEHVEQKDRFLLHNIGLRGQELDEALGK